MKKELFRQGLALFASLLISLPAVADQAGDRAMRQALDAARDRQWDKIDESAIEDHVLAGYIEYHRLYSRLPDVDAELINAFIQRHADSPLSEWLRNATQTSYGNAKRYDAFLAVSDGEPASIARQCHYYTALLDRQPDTAASGGKQLWLTGHSQPSACDFLFTTLRGRDVIDAEAIWQRLMLAWKAGEAGMMHFLASQLPESWDSAQQALDRLRKSYAAITRIPVDVGPEGTGSAALFSAAMYNFIRADTEAALEAWRKIAPHIPLSDEQRHELEHDLAFYSMVREVNNNEGWVDQVLPQLADGELLELRVRRALAERDWQGVIEWVHAMPDDPRLDSRWQYWLGRALEELGDPQTARKAYAAAADERDFFGFAAADRIQQPYELNLERISFDEADRRKVADWPVVKRAEALRRIGELGLARSEWFAAVERLDSEQVWALADYAFHQGWYPTLIHSTIITEHWNALNWRFPAAYQKQFEHWGEETGIDPTLLMGIARRESAFNHKAVSPVGARGLMQLMPGTASMVSRQLGIDSPSLRQLFDPELNIRLGSAYLSDMLDRYQGNRIAAAAAYNAGPSRVDRWLREAPRDFDLFIESIPFSETRAYVQAVLAYQVIFSSLAKGGETNDVVMLSTAERQMDYDGSLIARN